MPNSMTYHPLYQDVHAPNNTGREPCLSYTPYAMPTDDQGNKQIVYVLRADKLKQTAGRSWRKLEEKLNSGEIPRAKLATAMELQTLKGANIPPLPEELTDIVKNALAPKA